MARIAVDLDWPAFDRSDDDTPAVAGERERAGEAQRHARRHALGHFDIGHNLFGRTAAGGERQRRATDKQFQCGPAIDAAARSGRPLGIGIVMGMRRSSVADRAIGEVGVVDVLMRENDAAVVLVGGRLPIRIEHVGGRPQIWRRIAMAIETPSHCQRSGLPHQRHVPTGPWQVVHPTPFATCIE